MKNLTTVYGPEPAGRSLRQRGAGATAPAERLTRSMYYLLTLLGLLLALAPAAQAQTTCTQTTSLLFSDAAYSGSWINRTATPVPANSELTTIETGAVPNGGGSVTLTRSNAQLGGAQSLEWSADYGSGDDDETSVTFTFSRAVTNLRISVIDIDAASSAAGANFIDEVTFAGANGGTSVVPSLSKSGTGSGTVTITGTTARGNNSNATAANSVVTAQFASPITTLTLTYRNRSTDNNPDAQAIGITSILWCTAPPQAVNDVAAAVSYLATGISLDILANDLQDAELRATNKVDLNLSSGGVQSTYTNPATGIQYTANTNTGAITYTNPSKFVGTTTISYEVVDVNLLRSNTATLTLTLTNTAPVATDDPLTTGTGQNATVNVLTNDTDADGNASINAASVLLIQGASTGTSGIAGSNGGGTFSVSNTGVVTFVPAAGFSGTSGVRYTVQDEKGLTSNQGIINVTVVAPPVANNDSDTRSYTSTATINILGNDSGGQSTLNAATVTLIGTTTGTSNISGTNGGVFSVNGSGVVSVVSAPAFTGSSRVTTINYTVRNQQGQTSNPATLTVTFTNAAPVAVADAASTGTGQNATVNVLTNDTDADGNASINAASVLLIQGASTGTSGIAGSNGGGTFSVSNTGVVTFVPTVGFFGTSAVNYTVQDARGLTSNQATITITVTPPPTISGRVFEDVNYGGGSGVDYATANASAATSGFPLLSGSATDRIGRPNVRVELYQANGTYTQQFVTTGPNGEYSFPSTVALPNTGYIVRVVSGTGTGLRSVRTPGATGVFAVPTYVGAGPTASERVGGQDPTRIDAGNNTGSQAISSLTAGGATAQVQFALTTGGAGTTSTADFGFSYDVVANSNETGQGSLRQFLTNAGALANTNLDQRPFNNNGTPLGRDFASGEETSIFMVPDGSQRPGLRSGLTNQLRNAAGALAATGDRRVLITLASALPQMAAAGTVVDGTTQSTLFNSNPGQLGSGGIGPGSVRVGTSGRVLALVERPEVEISSPSFNIFTSTANNNALRGVSVHGGGLNVQVTGGTNFMLDQALVGIDAFSLAVPATNATSGTAITLTNASGTVQNCIIAYAGNSGLNYSGGSGQAGYTIRQNEFVQNGRTTAGGDAISVGDNGAAGPLLIEENMIRLSNSSGIQFEIGSVSNNIVRHNTIRDNGEGGLASSRLEGSGIHYLRRNTSVVSNNQDLIEQNVITSNQSSGIVVNTGQWGLRFSRNAIYDNGSRTDAGARGLISIDFTAGPNDRVGGDANYGQGNGVTPNDGAVTATGAAAAPNRGMDYPVITSITKTAQGKLRVQGYVGSAPGQSLFGGAIIEVFSADDTDTNQNGPTTTTSGDNVAHGEAQTYVGTVTAAANGNFDGVIDEPAANINIGDNITATAYLPAYGTSEAGVNRVSSFQVLPVELTRFVATRQGTDVVLDWATASEKNNDRFEVERSLNGTDFVRVGSVAGHGTTAAPHSYRHTDAGAGTLARQLYYRLRQVDMDGTATHSGIRTVEFAASTAPVTLAPNPTTGQLHLDLSSLPGATLTVTVTDLLGRRVLTQTVERSTKAPLSVRALPAGTYLLSIDAPGVHLTRKFIKHD
ncbi:Ig-like domain-containing protein [Hymenobacter sp. B81]|uniref:Ig-like domain-containing protein n=1 Tax=Hymenobacter sp. B81 TaxID=3344878 RepID=UPI0037DCFD2E